MNTSHNNFANIPQENVYIRIFDNNSHIHCYFCMCNENIKNGTVILKKVNCQRDYYK